MQKYDAILLIAFGGPEKPADVLPFLENVLRGRNVPRERMLEVAEHYYHFGGVSPINGQMRELVPLLEAELAAVRARQLVHGRPIRGICCGQHEQAMTATVCVLSVCRLQFAF